MKVLIWLQAIWCGYLAAVVIPWAWRVSSAVSLSLVALTVLYLAATVGLAMRSRASWLYSFVPPVLALYFVGPNIVANVFAFAIGDPWYLDSPGTIMVVAYEALFRLVPAVVLVILLLRVRRVVFT